MSGILLTGESLLLYLGILLVSLVMLYGLASLITKFAPSPVNGWFSAIIGRSTPAGWGVSTSNS